MTETAAGGPPHDPRPASLAAAEESVARAVEVNALWPAGATVVVAVSGGADSLCLLGTMLALRAVTRHGSSLPFVGEIVVATLDHGLRGAAGAADARWVCELAVSLNLRCFTEQVDTRAWARARHLSLEDAARRLRFAFLRRVASEVGAARICLGHTLDDQAETVILRLLRGSGLDGLAGMRPLRDDLARPLLGLTHAQAVAYCATRGWLPREDLTNRDERYLRNRVRRRLLPLLEAYNPNVRRTLARNAAFIADDLAALEAATDSAWAVVVEREDRDHVEMRLASLREQPLALRRRVLRRAADHVAESATVEDAGEANGLEARHITLIERFIVGGRTGGALTLPGGLRVALGYDTLSLTHAADATDATDATDAAQRHAGANGATEAAEVVEDVWRLPIPGAVDLPALGWRMVASLIATPPGLEGDALPPIPREAPLTHAGGSAASHRAELRVYLDADCLANDALTVRAWHPGDRMRPLGMVSEKKLQDIFSDAKVPRDARRRLPIVCSGERIVWVTGVRIADDAKLTAATRRILALQAEPLKIAHRARQALEESET
ncbi:MAG TPA: tRNA lysidine(34) synthetase TilS [Ktedonobacterales bacterium]|nr:tRNA lysidine(34) synthetase TilS [Ktedonobacterales bacterium]